MNDRRCAGCGRPFDSQGRYTHCWSCNQDLRMMQNRRVCVRCGSQLDAYGGCNECASKYVETSDAPTHTAPAYEGRLLNWKFGYHFKQMSGRVDMLPRCRHCNNPALLLDDDQVPCHKVCAEHMRGYHQVAVDMYCPLCNPNWRKV